MIDKEKIAAFQIFEGLNSDDLERIVQIAKEIAYKAGEVIIEETGGSDDSDLFLLLNGMIKVEIAAPGLQPEVKKNKRLAVLKDGAVFGEIGLLEGKGRSAKVSAYTDITVLRIDNKELFALLENDNHLGYLVMKNLAIILSDRLVELNFMWRDDI